MHPPFKGKKEKKLVKLAGRKNTCFAFTFIFIFVLVSFILASSRASTRAAQLLHSFRPRPVPTVANVGGSRPIMSSSMVPEKYSRPPQAPPTFKATRASILDDTRRLIDQSRKLQDKIVKDISLDSATFKNTLLPMALDDNEMELETNILGFYQSVSTDKTLRDASSESEKMFSEFGIESAMREDIFKLVDAANKRKDQLDPESQRLLEKNHKGYIQYGLGIPAGPKRDRFKAIKKRLSEIGIAFSKTLNEENGGVWFTREEIHGMPKDLVESFEKGKDGTEHAGKLRVTFKYPDLFPLMKYATNSSTRKDMFIANENKCGTNVALFREAVLLRDEAARLLGYPNHAAFRIEDKMAKTPKKVDDFLENLKTRLAPGGAKELQKLKDLKQSYLGKHPQHGLSSGGNDRYYVWDHRFFDRIMLENEYQLDQEKVAEYFPLSIAIQGMLHIFEELFGLKFVELDSESRNKLSPTKHGDDIVWHKDVQMFSVWDDEGEGSGFVGYLYLDLFPREGKYGHAANFNIQPGFIARDGSRRYPATALVCNFSKPSAKKPSLLKHDEVTTLFHELGHGIHDLVSRTTYSRFHGTKTVRDFVEAPSQMLENWCWTPSQLKSLSRHYSYLSADYKQAYLDSNPELSPSSPPPSEHIPDSLISSLIKTKHVNDALANLRQLHFGTFDMLIHEPKSHADLEHIDMSGKYNTMRKELVGMDDPTSDGKSPDWGHGEATFGHLIGGYDAGYYGYLYSQVYSMDMFHSVFAKDPLNHKEGRRYRHTVLEKGGSQEEMTSLKNFLGREPSPEAFYKELGLS